MPASSLTPQPTRIGGREFPWGSRTYVMGVLNLTPDSFSGDGLDTDVEAAIALASAMQAHGADIIDIGGESTRPGALPVSPDEELHRILPVLRRLKGQLDIPVSVDTYRADVAEAALAHGADMLNDIWGLRADPRIAHVAARAAVPVALMHNQRGPSYQDVVVDVIHSLKESMKRAEAAGILPSNIIVDPGFGFAKGPEENLELLRRLDQIKEALGRPVLLGTSRKSTLGVVLGLPVTERLEGTAATIAIAIAKGVDIVRVHDVREMVRVVRVSDAVIRGWRRPEVTP
ncbi:MAG: dihydropteroate synthase [Chloroflexi bacterium]|nr:dihydropteroate synthase [Chloroflexota bacterium]